MVRHRPGKTVLGPRFRQYGSQETGHRNPLERRGLDKKVYAAARGKCIVKNGSLLFLDY